MKRTCLFHISGNQYPAFPVAHHTRLIWDELSKGFDEYHVIARARGFRYVHSVDGSIHLHLLPAFGNRMWPFIFSSWSLPWFVFRYKPTHLLAQCPVLGGLAAAFCSILFRIPLLVELHGGHYFQRVRPGCSGKIESVFYRWFSRITFSAATRIRCLSDGMGRSVLQAYGETAHKKVVVIPNRVDLNIFRFFKSSYMLNGPLRLVTVGNFSKNKNHQALIKDLCGSGIDFKLTLVGEGPLKERYLDLADFLHARNNIEIVNLDHKSLAALLPQQDIYVHYSLSEGVSRAILEAMAAGLPVVATRVGFIDEVCNGNNAILIDKPYAANLIKALKLLAESEDLRKRMGVAARNTIEARFESNRIFEQYRSAIKTMNMEAR